MVHSSVHRSGATPEGTVGGQWLHVVMDGLAVLQEPVENLGRAEVLDAAGQCAALARQADARLLVLAYQWAVVHSDPTPSQGQAPQAGAAQADGDPGSEGGRERFRSYGGPGTDRVAEFAAAELGARIGVSTYTAGRLIADAQDLHHRLPLLFNRVQAGEVRSSYARHVAEKTRELSKDEARWVDGEVVESADGRLPWSRFAELVEGKIAVAAPELAKAREKTRRQARFARVVGTQASGMGTFMVRADWGTIRLIDAAVGRVASRLEGRLPDDPDQEPDGDGTVPMGIDDRRVQAMRLLCRPGAADDTDLADLLPGVDLVVHLLHDPAGPLAPGTGPESNAYGEPLDRVARLEGHGPVTGTWLREVLGPHARFTVKPVFYPLAQAPVDAYEIPSRLRAAVRLLSPADCFPWGTSTHGGMDLDHTAPYRAGPEGRPGQTAVGNLGPLSRTHHRIKTHGAWEHRQPFPGIHLWRDAYGHLYLVDHTGTRALAPPGGAARDPGASQQHAPVGHSDIGAPRRNRGALSSRRCAGTSGDESPLLPPPHHDGVRQAPHRVEDHGLAVGQPHDGAGGDDGGHHERNDGPHQRRGPDDGQGVGAEPTVPLVTPLERIEAGDVAGSRAAGHHAAPRATHRDGEQPESLQDLSQRQGDDCAGDERGHHHGVDARDGQTVSRPQHRRPPRSNVRRTGPTGRRASGTGRSDRAPRR